MGRIHQFIKYSLYLILFLPLLFTSFTFFPWHFGKTMIFQIMVELLAVLFLWSWATRRGWGNCPPLPEGGRGGVGEDVPSLRRRGLRGGFNWLDWSVLLFLAIITLTSLTGVNPANSFWGNQARANGVFTWLHFGAFYFLLVWVFRNCRESVVETTRRVVSTTGNGRSFLRPNWQIFFVLNVIVAVLISLTSLFPQLLPFSWQAASGGGLIGNRAFLASYLILAIGISLYLRAVPSLRRRGLRGGFILKWPWLFLAAPVLFIYTIIDTGNRGALLGIVAGIFLGAALCLLLVRNKKAKIWSAVSLLVLCSLFFTLFLSRQSLFLQRHFPAVVGLTNISFSEGTTQTRLMAWQSAWQGIKERPFQGWGWGNYGVVFDKYYNSQFLKHGFTETVWDKPHNWLLEIGVAAGILGVIGYLAILFFAGFYLLKKNIVVVETNGRSSLHGRSSLQSGNGCSSSVVETTRRVVSTTGKIILSTTLFAYFVADLFLFETTNSLILWFAILAFVSSTSVIPAKAGIQDGSKLLDSPRILRGGNDKVRWLFVLLAILLISLSLYLFHYLPLKFSYYMRQAELSTALMDWAGFANQALAVETTRRVVSTTFLPENAVFLAEQFTKFDKAGAIAKEKKVEDTALKISGVLEEASSKYPDNLSFPVWAGQVYMVLGEKTDEKYYQPAEENLLKAEKISPQKQEVLFLLGRLYLLEKDFDRALSFQKKAVEAAPEINTSHWFLGLTYVAQGERAEGLEEIEKAEQLGYNLTKEQKLYVLDLYALEKNYSKLIEEYKKLIDEDPGNLNWYIKLAVVYAESGDKKSALETVRYAVGLFPPLKAEADRFIKKYKLDKD